MQLFDSHCHIDLDDFASDRDAVLHQARIAGVRDLLVPGVQRSTWPALLDLCANDPHLHPALGLHPMFMHAHVDGDLQALRDAIAQTRPAAIGEIGLDWHAKDADRERQRRLFDDQLAIAADCGLPVVLHVRKAHDAVLASLRRSRVRGGFCHAFNGSEQQAAHYADLGFKLGFGGMLTFERSTRLRRLAGVLPLDTIVLETDAPDMTVSSHRYERNSPAYLPEVLQTLAQLRNADAADIARQTTRNVYEVLGI